jgi:hypothetical protein
MASVYTQIAKKRTEQSKQALLPSQKSTTNIINDTAVSRHHDTKTPRTQDTTVTSENDPIEFIRRAVKKFGKESATQRLTSEEKRDLRDIEYVYDKQGIKTTGNEIIRIAINYLVMDYKKNGSSSTLDKVLRKLKS